MAAFTLIYTNWFKDGQDLLEMKVTVVAFLHTIEI